MYLCYLDESGTADIPGNTSHYVLAGIAIPIRSWKKCDQDIAAIKKSYGLDNAELHTAWILRAYPEQNLIPNFASLTHVERALAVEQWRRGELLRLQRVGKNKLYRQVRKNYRKTDPYIHLTRSERKQLMVDVARCVAGWNSARLFAECVNKIYFAPNRVARTPDEEALEQVVSRFEHYLRAISGPPQSTQMYGLLIHDNNETVAKKHTNLMLKFHESGTLWTDVSHIMETPLFVNSELTGMVQIADLCSYSIRRYLENNESELFDIIFARADRRNGVTVGVRHFSPASCGCKICVGHRR